MPELLPLLIPIENQVRELDPKLLLAVTAAKAGMRSYIGYRTEMDIMINKLPRGIYLAKSFTRRSDKMFRILSKLGYIICAWDEEALVHYPPDIYFTRRLSPKALSYVAHLFAWGKENEELFNAYPHLPENIPIHRVGNPRLDLLSEQFESFYNDEVDRIRQQYGKFILINTNFGNVNAQLPYLNLFTGQDKQGNYLTMGRGATGMSREFAEGRAKYKQTVFEKFIALIPGLAESFQDTNIIIRPHPVENKQPYTQLANELNNVHVVRQGNVIPWLRAAKILIHNSCTTGIEAYLSGLPSIAYVPVDYRQFGDQLPNQFSHHCRSMAAVQTMTEKALSDCLPAIESAALSNHIEFNPGFLCSSKIAEILLGINAETGTYKREQHHFYGQLLANKRRITKRIKSKFPQSKYHKSFQELRFPALNETELRTKVNTFAKILDMNTPPAIKPVFPHIFLVQ